MGDSSSHHTAKACDQGPSSFAMQDPAVIFKALGLGPGMTFLDLGCGPGDYSLAASEVVGPAGRVHALDEWERMVSTVRDRARQQGRTNVLALVADMRAALPLADQSVDACLPAMVLHYLRPRGGGDVLWREIRRVLRPGGRLAVLNCKKEEQPFGPSIHVRWSPRETCSLIEPYGFRELDVLDLGYNYLACFAPC